MVERWFLPTVSEILPPDGTSASAGPEAARQRWRCALEALGQLLERQVTTADRDWSAAQGNLQDPDPPLHGLVLAGPSPLFHQPLLRSRFAHWTFSGTPSPSLWQLPARPPCPTAQATQRPPCPERAIALRPMDPLTEETFCLALTAQFALLLVLRGQGGQPSFQFSFDPAVISRTLQALRGRIALNNRQHLDRLDLLFSQFAPVEPHYSLVMEFGQLLMQAMPVGAPAPRRAAHGPCQRSMGVAPARPVAPPSAGRRDRAGRPSPKAPEPTAPTGPADSSGPTAIDVQLLEAIAHGVRTPLATIRTLTRLMMKRRSLTADLRPFLEKIDLACTDQIERFDLIFKAVEMATTSNSAPTPLAPTPLAQIFQHGIPRWQRQALQHNLDLKVELPPQLPMVHTDSALLDRMLTQLIEDLTRGLTAGSAIAMRVSMAGSQLKLQLHCQAAAPAVPLRVASGQQRIRSIGQVLTFQPETGNLGLNLKVTKNLFQSIGGKLIIRQRPEVGEVVTIFLPLERATGHGYDR